MPSVGDSKDDDGRKVAAEANGKKVEMREKVQDRVGVKWIAVTSRKIVE